MIHETSSAVLSVDIVCLLAEPTKNKKSEMYLLLEKIAAGGIPTILALSKSDIYSRKELLDAADKYSGFGNFQHIIPISARQGENIEKLEQLIVDSLPISQPLYTPEQITTQTDLFLTAEFIREQIFLLLHQELPYTIFVETDLIENTDDAVQIDATIIVSKENHKPMVLGKGGKMLKEIGTRARKELKAHFGKNVHLNLWVKIGNTEDAYL
jgi:GTP-binding protein Era